MSRRSRGLCRPAIVELAIDHGHRRVAAVTRCGAVSAALGPPAEMYQAFPAMSIDTYAIRAGAEPGDLEALTRVTGEIEMVERGPSGTDTPLTDLPILSVNTADDQVAPHVMVALLLGAVPARRTSFIATGSLVQAAIARLSREYPCLISL